MLQHSWSEVSPSNDSKNITIAETIANGDISQTHSFQCHESLRKFKYSMKVSTSNRWMLTHGFGKANETIPLLYASSIVVPSMSEIVAVSFWHHSPPGPSCTSHSWLAGSVVSVGTNSISFRAASAVLLTWNSCQNFVDLLNVVQCKTTALQEFDITCCIFGKQATYLELASNCSTRTLGQQPFYCFHGDNRVQVCSRLCMTTTRTNKHMQKIAEPILWPNCDSRLHWLGWHLKSGQVETTFSWTNVATQKFPKYYITTVRLSTISPCSQLYLSILYSFNWCSSVCHGSC